MTREKAGKIQVLVFKHPITEAGIQIPKGTVEPGEDTLTAVIREIKEETGIENFKIEHLIAVDYWENDNGEIHNRYFYKISVPEASDEWDYRPTGGEGEEGLIFHFFWISSIDEVDIVPGHGDYLDRIFK